MAVEKRLWENITEKKSAAKEKAQAGKLAPNFIPVSRVANLEG
jgi:hypothetical protein